MLKPGRYDNAGAITKTIQTLPVLALAIIIDVIKIIPYFDCVVTVWLQIILWRTMLDNEYFQWLNICYDLADFPGMVNPFADIFPLNTVTVIIYIAYSNVKWNV